jgi:hypothetical protein
MEGACDCGEVPQRQRPPPELKQRVREKDKMKMKSISIAEFGLMRKVDDSWSELGSIRVD